MNSAVSRERDILWCTNAINTLGVVGTLTDYIYVLSHVCNLLMQCSALTSETQAWLNGKRGNPAMREAVNSDPVMRPDAVRNLLVEYEQAVLLPGLNGKFSGLSEAELRRSAAKIELYGCWTPGSPVDELVEAMFRGYVYVVGHIYGGVLKGSSSLDGLELRLFAVSADILFPHTGASVPTFSAFQSGASLDKGTGERLAQRYINMVHAQGNKRVLLAFDRAHLARLFASLTLYTTLHATRADETGIRMSNRLRSFAYLYDRWCQS